MREVAFAQVKPDPLHRVHWGEAGGNGKRVMVSDTCKARVS